MGAVPRMAPPDRTRALRYGADGALFGVGGAHPQIVEPLDPTTLRSMLSLGALTAQQWATAFRKLDPHTSSALRRAVAQALPLGSLDLAFTVRGSGAIARAVRELLSTMGAVEEPRRRLLIHVGAPGTLVPTADEFTLPVEIGPDQIVIGPLLRDDVGPCPSCLHLRRQHLDPRWEQVQQQLHQLQLCDGEPTTSAELAHLAVGLTGLVARGIACGRPLAAGVALSMVAGEAALNHHVWPVHPLCECRNVPQIVADGTDG